MGISPEELASRQKRNRERQRDAKAFRLQKKADRLGVSVAKARTLINTNKAQAARDLQAADRRRDLMSDIDIHLAECEWRGLVLPDDVKAQLQRATSRVGFREDNMRALLAVSGDAISVAAVANAQRILRAGTP